jgi:DNA-directed RNA polymerase specialized sigma24 family protein
VNVGLFPRKANLGPVHGALGFKIEFGKEWTLVERTSVADVQELAGNLSLPQRMSHLLKRGSMTYKEIAEELDAKVDTVEKAVKRNPKRFLKLPGPDGLYRIGLLEAQQSA